MASMSRDRSSSSTSSSDLGRPELLSRGGRDAGMSYLSPTNAPLPVLTESYRTSPDKYKKSSHRSRSDRRRNDGSGTRELVQMLLSEERDAKDALRALNKTADRLAEETRRADEAERKLVQSHERFKMVNQARQTALQDVSRLQEELRLYKLQLENAQTQITRANEMIAQSDKERHAAEEAAEKARDTARKYHEERLVRDAREEGRKLGRDEGKEEGIKIGYNQALENAYKRARRDAFARLDEYLESQGMELPNVLAEEDEGDDAPEAPGLGFRGAGSIRAASDIADDVLSELDLQNPPRPIQMPVPVTDRRTNIVPPIRPSSSASQPTHRRVISRFLGRRRGNGIDPNVEINRDAPDLAPIVESGPILPVATPLPASATAQPARTSTVSPGPVRMPEPDFNPDPSTVQPIPVRNRSPSIRHSAYDIPPDGFIPTATPDGRIGVPPPHELSRQPSLSGSLADFGGPPIPPKSPIARDFAAEEAERRARSRSPGPSMRGGGGVTPVYQAANITGAYDFDGRSTPGRARTPVHDNGLHRSGSYSSMHSRPRSPVGPRNPEYADPPMAMPEASPMFSPRSGRSFTPGPGPPGPRRPAHLTMPTPLAEQSTGPQVYTRPRINSTGSDMPSDRFSMRSPGFSSGGGIGLGGGGGGGDPRRPPMHRRGTSVTSSGVPDITIEPPV